MILPYLRLLRIGLIASPAADVVAGVCIGVWGWPSPEAAGSSGALWGSDPLAGRTVRAALASMLIYAAGMALNDHADRAEDAVQRPERPIPSGRVPAVAALALGAVLMAGGLALSPVPALHAGIAAGVLVYDYVLKRWAPTWIAGLLMGALRSANLSVGLLLAASLAPEGFAPLERQLPWVAVAVYGAYVLCVTILGGYEDVTPVPQKAVRAIQTIPPVAAALVVAWSPADNLAPVLGLVLAGLFLLRVGRIGLAWDQGSIRTSMGWLLLGTMLYTALLCLGHGRGLEAVGILAAAFGARQLMRFVPLT